jgi:large subunit ribosomal protein L4
MNMSVQVPASDNSGASVQVVDEVFAKEYNEGLVHQVVVAYLEKSRAGTKAQKTRSEVSGGGAKPWRQKGSGRARAGTTRSPLWRTGGVTFAAKPREFGQKVNRKMYRAAMCSILSELLRQGRITVNDAVVPEEPKTKAFLGRLGDAGKSRTLIVTDQINETLWLSARNVANVALSTSAALDPYTLVSAERVIATRAALKSLEDRLK